MNRREMIQAGMSVIASAGLEGEVKTLSVNDPQAVVLLFPHRINSEQKKLLQKAWNQAFSGKPLEYVPVVVLDSGADIKVIDRTEP